MKRIYFYLAGMLVACAAQNSYAQNLKVPQLSSSQTITQELGLGGAVGRGSQRRPHLRRRPRRVHAPRPSQLERRVGADRAVEVQVQLGLRHPGRESAEVAS